MPLPPLLSPLSGQAHPLGVSKQANTLNIAVRAPAATAVSWCFFDADGKPLISVLLSANTDGIWHGALILSDLPDTGDCWYYGLRADGDYMPEQGLFFDPNKLLLDPYAKEISTSFAYHPDLCAPRTANIDTAPLMPKAVLRRTELDTPLSTLPTQATTKPQFIYEVNVKALSQLHPNVPAEIRGTVLALCEPCVIDHLKMLGVDAIELMPIAAWMDERHLPPLGLRNAWGYNPVGMMAVEPRLCPNGAADMRRVVQTLRAAGIAVILDVVFNHTGESDMHGATLSLRGLDNRYYFRHTYDEANQNMVLSNDAGCGNTLDCAQAGVQELILDTLRYFVRDWGVAGFRFDLAPVLGRNAQGFFPQAPLLQRIEQDEVLSNALLIAEPWDIGAHGYQLGQFAPKWLEWNDRYRDTVRRFWRGDSVLGEFATRIAGSSDVFAHNGTQTRSVNFLCAHDGMTLRDVVSYTHKHNEANGEHNRDGHNENFSWNHGIEGASDDAAVIKMRRQDVAAMVATLVFSRGTPMLTAGDEFGRTQLGNNNAYAQDNEITWLDWACADKALAVFVGYCVRLRHRFSMLREDAWLNTSNARWWRGDGQLMQTSDWHDATRQYLGLELIHPREGSVWLWFNAQHDAATVQLPPTAICICNSASLCAAPDNPPQLPARSVTLWHSAHTDTL